MAPVGIHEMHASIGESIRAQPLPDRKDIQGRVTVRNIGNFFEAAEREIREAFKREKCDDTDLSEMRANLNRRIESVGSRLNDMGKDVEKLSTGMMEVKQRLVESEDEVVKSQGRAELIEKRMLKKQIDNMGLMMKNITEWAIAVPRSILTIALIPPILKYVFGVEKKKAEPVAAKNQAEQVVSNVEDYRKMTGMQSNDFYRSFRFDPKWFGQAKGGNN